MPKFMDLTGKTFGYLTPIKLLPKTKHGKNRWLCKCKCGKFATPITYNLTHGITLSCGCIRHDPSHETYTHGKSKERIYSIYLGMKKRCYNTNEKSYPRYGGKGITICAEWLNDFMSFYNWSMANGYNDSLSIDRIDNLKGYSPDNCRWITMADQAKNKSNNTYISHNGETKIIADWCRELNFPEGAAHQRYRNCIKQGKTPTYELIFFNGNRSCKKLYQYSIDGELIKIWNSKADAVRAGFSNSGIIRCTKGKFKQSGGFVWRYAE